MPEVKPSEVESTASIKVIGVGGAGGRVLLGRAGRGTRTRDASA